MFARVAGAREAQDFLLHRLFDWWVGALPTGTGVSARYTASLTLYCLNAFFIILTHSQLGPRFAMYPLALSAKKSSFFGVRKL